jgi:hypothetical protein
MAQRVMTILEDDTDGSEATQTVAFALDGTRYEIDLSDENAEAMRDALGEWTQHARRIGGRRRSAAKAKTNGTANTSDIREWALKAGYEVSARGRISAAVREAYEAAH